jgi:subtilisin family serine protease
MDDNAHGTHCAGTIGGVGNNGIGVVGVAPQISIMACKFLDNKGSGAISDAIACLEYALRMGATITSNSWGGGDSSSALSMMLNIAESKGQLFVTAAGNSGGDNDRKPQFPGNYPQDIVISVASTTETDQLSSFSCYGSFSVDMGAPGSNIVSTIPGGYYASYSGTSMATPHVAGALALMYSIKPSLSAVDAKRIVMSTGTTLSSLAKTVSGKRLDLAAALAATGTSTVPNPSPNPSPEPCFFCQDNPSYLSGGRQGRGCDWVGKQSGSKRCAKGVDVLGCPVTCGACTLVSN